MQVQNPSPPLSQDINNFRSGQKTEQGLPSEEPKGERSRFVLVAVFVILFLILFSSIVYYLILLGEDKVLENEDFVREEIEVVLEDAEQDDIELLVFDLENFIRNCIQQHGIEDYDFYEQSYLKRQETEGEYYGMRWFDDQGDVELIRGQSEFTFDLWIHDDMDFDERNLLHEERELYIKDCFNETKHFLEGEGFVVNFEKESDFGEAWMYGLEKNEKKCLVYRRGNYPQMSLECGDFNNVETPVEFKEIYRDINPMEHDNYLHVEKVSGDFAYVGKSNYHLGGAWHFLKKENGVWEKKALTQGYIQCGVLFEMNMKPETFEELTSNVTPSLYECEGKETYREYYEVKTY